MFMLKNNGLAVSDGEQYLLWVSHVIRLFTKRPLRRTTLHDLILTLLFDKLLKCQSGVVVGLRPGNAFAYDV